jgi:hypothetical protein
MGSFQDNMQEYRNLLKRGALQDAYKGLMVFIMSLRTHFMKKYPEYFISGIYYGYMDMTYFSCSPKSLKDRKLKIAIVFNHEAFRFEVWLAGNNKQVQSEYWKLFMESGWQIYHLVPTTKGVDSIVEHIIVNNPDFSNLDQLTSRIETGTLKFIRDIESFLNEQ